MRAQDCRKTAARLPKLLQGCCKTRKAFVRLVSALALAYFVHCRVITVQRPCAVLHVCRKNPTNRPTTHEVCTTVARPHLRQSCNSTSTSGDSPACERRPSVRALYGRLTFSENPPEVCNFVCDLPHGLTLAANRTAKRTYD